MNELLSVTCRKERSLIARARRGDSDAQRILIEKNHKQVFAVCLRMTRSVTDAEDLTQEAFVHVLSRLKTFRGKSSLSTWIYRIAVNTTLMHFRKNQIRRATSLETGQNPSDRDDSGREHIDVPQIDQQLKSALNRLALSRALEKLPTGCRTVLEMHDIQGYAHHEIAKLLRCATGTSKSQLHKARRKMREALQPDFCRPSIVPREPVFGYSATSPVIPIAA
ncbi:MAG TPA: RNA polymerase sigma factor [Terriglobales bacterium]|nr:RNA polymerase sigma factor [Terriglobales bacterium]